MTRYDVAIVGAGIAGASLAAEVAPHASVLLLEAETQPGYHSTGRSAAFWSETYGGPLIQPLTTASRSFLEAPPPDFSNRSFLRPRGALHLADASGERALDRLFADFAETDVELRILRRKDLLGILPTLRTGWDRALLEPSCADIDVAALHAAYLRAARRAGAVLVGDARLEAAERIDGGWALRTSAGHYRADTLVNAAGAWADHVALLAGERPLDLQPYRRTVVQVAVAPPAAPDLPLVIDARERFYFKPEAGGRLWLSPHDETACDPSDCQPEQLDVALAVARFEDVSEQEVSRVERSWAGLRTFAPDRLPVYGWSESDRAFFWCAGQGGFGIQTAPAAAKLAAGLLLGRELALTARQIDPTVFGPGRF